MRARQIAGAQESALTRALHLDARRALRRAFGREKGVKKGDKQGAGKGARK